MKFHKITSVFYYIISAIVFYSLLELSITYSFQIHIVLSFLPPFVIIFSVVIFCIWLVMTITKLIKKSSVAFSKGEDAKGERLRVALLFLLVVSFCTFFFCLLLFLTL